jgi:homoserine O-acetyltransferase
MDQPVIVVKASRAASPAEAEVALLSDARLEVIPSAWGHYAGGGRDPEDTTFIDRRLQRLLAS